MPSKLGTIMGDGICVRVSTKAIDKTEFQGRGREKIIKMSMSVPKSSFLKQYKVT